MAGMLRFFRPILEWLEARFVPAIIAPAVPDVQHAFFLGEPPQAPPGFDAASADLVFSTGGLLPYLDDAHVAPGQQTVPPAEPPPPPPAAVDAVFTLGLLPPMPSPAPAVTDDLFAVGFTPMHAMFDFTPPPPPKGLPMTPYGAGSSAVQPLELVALTGAAADDEMPDTADDSDTPDADQDDAEVAEAALAA